jgi:hypothetical protein
MRQQKKHATTSRRAPIQPKQITLIHIAKGDLGLTDELYRDMLREMFGAESSKDLDAAQADQLIDEFKARGFRIVSRHPRPARRAKGKNVVHLVRPAEIDKLNAVAGLIKWQVADGLPRFLEKRVGIKGGKVRTGAEAYRAIEALKKLFENGVKKQHGEGWWTIRFDAPEIEEYISRHAPAEYRDSAGRVYKQAQAL